MAIEVCTEISNSPGISPRISFSHDLKNSNGSIPVEDCHLRSDLRLLDSTSDFVFSITNGLSQQLSSADELFSNGKIVPMEIKKVISNGKIFPKKKSSSADKFFEPLQKTTVKKRLKEFLSDETDNEEERPSLSSSSSKYFWKFKRSSSLNFDTTGRNSLIRSLQFLSRSNSTGSAPNPKQAELQRERQKQKLQKQSSVSSSRRSSSSSSTSSTYYFYNSSNKSSLKKCSSNGVRISPVLNLPQAYIPKVTANFFGFGSLFCKGKIKRKKK
ncbi:hypothetical protein L195_g005526 [Trifolium pratense]|uniref:Uncharacterized protein n=2 Tax=Trifolium pratense TaxID=57577 RepID=A0ACB0IFS7_TRIPR|nr:vitellogenin-1 [Trifolium pratense]PNY08984.1 hypothetical protein L195_g005526 [Trifolium pratense]CAJ2630698.1 unnamed protein product [Trifolium pratense]